MIDKQETILITGGTGKIGKPIVRDFLSKGYTVVITHREQNSLEKLKEYCDNKNLEQLFTINVDFTEKNVANTILQFLQENNLKPNCLINNARSLEFLKTETTGIVNRENFIGEFVIDVVIPYELTMVLSSEFKGILNRVINISSQYGVVAANSTLYEDHNRQSAIHYSVAKSAVIHLTRELAVRLAPQEIQVNCVAFGGIEGRVDSSFRERYGQLNPLGRMLREDEVVGPITFLSSEACSGMTGHTLVVDGGWTIW